MHACIAAFSSGVPVVPMAYSRKFNGLFGTLGYNEIADCKKDNDDEVLKKIMAGFNNRDELHKKIKLSLTQVNERLSRYETNIAEIFKSAYSA
jgi:polysaccharide pyruvyl transferase WcaK-like protein